MASTYPGEGSIADGICAALAQYDLAQLHAKKPLARANATLKLTGDANASDASILQALWVAMENKRLVDITQRFDRLSHQGKLPQQH